MISNIKARLRIWDPTSDPTSDQQRPEDFKCAKKHVSFERNDTDDKMIFTFKEEQVKKILSY